MNGPETPVVELEHLSKSYGGETAVRDVEFSIAAGECVAMIGHNGAGKTTIMKMILGLITPSAGRVRIFADDIGAVGRDRAARRTGYLPEVISFPPQLSGMEALRYFARLKGVALDGCPSRLAAVGLDAAADKRIGAYSKGMRQRLGLAQALLGEPDLLVLDEPTTGLDPQLRRLFYGLIEERRAAGAAILMSSHALSELQGHVDRILVINRGRLVADGSLAALRLRAGLPVLIRVRADAAHGQFSANLPDHVDCRKINGSTVELSCAPDRKVEVIRMVATCGYGIDDLDVELPDLDRLYRHYCDDAEDTP